MKIEFQGRLEPILSKYPFCVIDVGARDGYQSSLEPLKRHLRVLGFEPDQEEFERLAGHSPVGGGGRTSLM